MRATQPSGRFVTIVQHPRGEKKQIALRENRIVDVLDSFLHYEADTEPGSSGSPVFDDGWEVVALHHASVRAPDHAELGGFVNEGIRVSGLRAFITAQSSLGPSKGRSSTSCSHERPARSLRRRCSRGSRSTRTTPAGVATTRSSSAPARTGCRCRPSPTSSSRWRRSTRRATSEPSLRAAVPPLQRRAESGASSRVLHGGQHRRHDEHAPQARDATAGSSIRACRQSEQTGEEAYRDNPLDRGHLVRRLDPAWGASRDEAKRSNDDTFHFTNCTPAARGLQPEPDDLGRSRGLHPRERGQPGPQGDRRSPARCSRTTTSISRRPAAAAVLEGRRR